MTTSAPNAPTSSHQVGTAGRTINNPMPTTAAMMDPISTTHEAGPVSATRSANCRAAIATLAKKSSPQP